MDISLPGDYKSHSTCIITTGSISSFSLTFQ